MKNRLRTLSIPRNVSILVTCLGLILLAPLVVTGKSVKPSTNSQAATKVSPRTIQRIKQDAITRFKTSATNLKVHFINDPTPGSGWYISLKDNAQIYVYHVDDDGKTFKAKPMLQFSTAVKVQKIVALQLGVPTNNLRITDAIESKFYNSCLDISEKCEGDRKININGWKVVVNNENQGHVIYHIDQSAERVFINSDAARVPENVSISLGETSNYLHDNVVFRSFSTETQHLSSRWLVLTEDGKLKSYSGIVIDEEKGELVKVVSPEQMNIFKALLLQQNMAKFNGMNYSTASDRPFHNSLGTIESKNSNIGLYNISSKDLPLALKNIYSAWGDILEDEFLRKFRK